MRKASEILKAALPLYKLNTGLYMCCLIDNAYFINGSNFEMVLTLAELRSVKHEILSRIHPYVTLMSYLEGSDQIYKATYENLGDQDSPMIGHRTPECHQLRIDWFENLIQELEKEGK